eukprot:1746525-Pleurochrysis_carterae.AAC.2
MHSRKRIRAHERTHAPTHASAHAQCVDASGADAGVRVAGLRLSCRAQVIVLNKVDIPEVTSAPPAISARSERDRNIHLCLPDVSSTSTHSL